MALTQGSKVEGAYAASDNVYEALIEVSTESSLLLQVHYRVYVKGIDFYDCAGVQH